MIEGTAEILEMNKHTVVYKYSIGETPREDVIITMTRSRWEKMERDTSLNIKIVFPHEQPKFVDEDFGL